MNINDLQAGSYQVKTQGTGANLNVKNLSPGSYTVNQPTQTPQSPPSNYDTSQQTYNPWFAAAPTDNSAIAGLKAAGNLGSSAWNLAKGIGTAIMHPITTGKTLVQAGAGGIQSIPGVSDWFDKESKGGASNPLLEENRAKFHALADALYNRYGTLQNAGITATNDPFGVGADILGILTGGAETADKLGVTEGAADLVGSGIGKVGGGVSDAASKVLSPVAEKAGGLAKFGVSQATGLNPSTISELVNNPAEVSAAPSREELATQVKTNIDSRLKDLSETGKGYEEIRQSPQTVTVPKQQISDILDKYHIQLDNEGKIVTNVESLPMSAADKSSLQNFLDTFGKEEKLTGNGFLNARQELSNMSKFDQAKTSASTTMAKELRGALDSAGKEQLDGLKDLDSKYSSERKLLTKVKKDWLNADGSLKDSAMSKIANLTNKNRITTLDRLEQVMPGVSKQVNALKAVEDIQNASGIKVGTYTRAGVLGAGIATANIPAIVGAIIASPELAVRLIKGFGLAKSEIGEVLNSLNEFKVPQRVSQLADATKDMPMGMSIKNVGYIHPEDMNEMSDFTDYVAGSYKPKDPVQIETDARRIAEKYGINPEQSNKKLANDFGKVLEKKNFNPRGLKKPDSFLR